MIVPGDLARRRALGGVPARLLPAGARALAPVPTAIPREAPRRTPGQSPEVLRRSCRPRRRAGVRGVSRTATPNRMGRLYQAPVRWATGRAGLSVALYPPRRHRQQPADRLRPHRRHLPMERLSCRWSRAPEDHDTLNRRVHPSLPDPRPAARLPPHPSLRPARQRHTRRQHRPRTPLARRAGGTARGQGYQLRRGQRAQTALAPVPVLRRPHGHHRDIPPRRLAALSAGGIPNRDQDRHVMIAVVCGNITNLRVNFAGSRPATELLVAEATWATDLSTNLGSMPALPSMIARSNPPNFPRFPPLEVCGRRPPCARRHLHGPASENLHKSRRDVLGIGCLYHPRK